jgi:Dolichyl-phosphate-mannose-protein mannosyltransferase
MCEPIVVPSIKDSQARTAGLSFWRSACGAAVVFCFSCSVFWITCRVVKVPPAWRTFEFCQYAEIGRNLVVDGRYNTRLVEPMALAFLDRVRRGARDARWPVVNRYPLPGLAVAAVMRILGTNDMAAAWSNGLAISLLAALCYVQARRWYGPGWAAVVGLLFLTNPSFYGEFILLGTPDVWFATIFLLVLLLWSGRGPSTPSRGRLGWALGLGLLSGVAYLARFNATLFLGVLGLALLWQRRWRETAVMTMTALFLVSPLFMYNWHHFRSPFVPLYSSWNLLDGIGGYRVEPWLYYRVPNISAELRAHSGGLARKFATNLFTIVPLRIWSLWRLDLILPLALVAPAFLRGQRPTGQFAAWSVGFFALQLGVFSALRLELQDSLSPNHGRYFFWFAVPALLLGVGVLRRLRSRPGPLSWLAFVVVVAQVALFGSGWRDIALRHASETNLGHDPLRRALTRLVIDDRVIASNQPQITAWFCGLRSISLPADPAELAALNRVSSTPADFLFIDINFNCIDLDPRWGGLAAADPRMASPWEAELLRDYEYVLPPGQTRPLLYVLLRRRVITPSPLERQLNPAAAGGKRAARSADPENGLPLMINDGPPVEAVTVRSAAVSGHSGFHSGRSNQANRAPPEDFRVPIIPDVPSTPRPAVCRMASSGGRAAYCRARGGSSGRRRKSVSRRRRGYKEAGPSRARCDRPGRRRRGCGENRQA